MAARRSTGAPSSPHQKLRAMSDAGSSAATTAMTVSEARGVILLAIEKNSVPLLELTPLQVKQAVVGYGQATKEQVTYMTQRLLCLEKKPTPDDAADALAIAICSAHCSSAEKIRQGLNRL